MVHGVEFTVKEALGLSWNYLDNENDNYPFSLGIEGNYPEHALHEYKGIFGGYEFKNDTLKFRTPNGIRSCGHEACAVFNQNGEGVIFFKQ